jgi:hypothetical protein
VGSIHQTLLCPQARQHQKRPRLLGVGSCPDRPTAAALIPVWSVNRVGRRSRGDGSCAGGHGSGNDWAPSRRKGRVVNGILGAIANQLGHSTTATAIRMASVANDIPASGPKPSGGCQAFVTVLPPHGKESDASHTVHPDALTEETFAFDFAIVWVHGPEDQLVTANGLNLATCR